MLFRAGFVGRQVVGSGVSVVPAFDMNFMSGVLDPSITWTRNSIATDGLYTDAPGSTYNTFGVNVPRISATRGLLIESARNNWLLNSDAPATQTINPAGVATYCLWIIGTGSATVTAGTAVGTGFGTATQGVPNSFSITTAGSITITVAGQLNRFQLESGVNVPTSYIPTAGATVARQAETGVLTLGPWYNATEGTEVIDFVKIVSPGGAFDDVPCLWQDTANMIGARLPGGLNMHSLVWAANVVTASTAQVPYNLGSVNKSGTTYNRTANTITASVNGGVVNSAPVSAWPTPTQFRFGITRSSAINGWVRRLRYWSRALNASELQAVTSTANDATDLDFMTPNVLDPRIVFSRASPATYMDNTGTLRTAIAGQPRWNYDNGGATLRGMLMETQRTNLVTQSDTFTTFGGAQATITQAATTAPTGAMTGVRFTEDTNTGDHGMDFAFPPTANAVYTCSVYVKADTRTKVGIGLRQTSNWVSASTCMADLVAGTVVSLSGTNTHTIQNIGNGWYRISTTATVIAAPVGNCVFRPLLIGPANFNNYVGDGASGAFFWGAQIEASAFPSSYISSGASATTRSTDHCTLTDAVLFGGTTDRTIAVDAFRQQVMPVGIQAQWLVLHDGTANNYMQIISPQTVPNTRYAATVAGVVKVNGGDQSNGTPPNAFKVAFTNGAVGNYASNGVLGPSSGLVSQQLGPLTTLSIGESYVGTLQIDGAIQRVRYWSRALSPVELQQVTT